MKTASMALALVLVSASSALAQDAAEPPAAPSIVRLARGDRAPSDGLLAPESLFVDWRTRIVILEEQLRIEATAATAREHTFSELCDQRLELAGQRVELVDRLWRERAEELSRQLAEEQREDVFDSPLFWYFMGAATVVVLGVAAGVIGFSVTQ